MRQILQLDFINNPVSKIAGYRNQVFSIFPTCMILDTLDRGGKDAYNNASMTQAASRVPDNLFDKSAPPSLMPLPPVVSHTHKVEKKKSIKVLAPTEPVDDKKEKTLTPKKTPSKLSKTDSKSRPLKRTSKNSVKARSSKGAKLSKMPISLGRSKSARAGLTFPVARLHRHIKSSMQGLRVAHGSAVFMAATL